MQDNPKPAKDASTATKPYPYGPPPSLLGNPARMAEFQQVVAREVAAIVAARLEVIAGRVIVREVTR